VHTNTVAGNAAQHAPRRHHAPERHRHDHLRRIVDQVGGFDLARLAILDRAVKIQPFGSLEDYRALIAVFDRVEALARRAGS
jgi:hypothetical protein